MTVYLDKQPVEYGLMDHLGRTFQLSVRRMRALRRGLARTIV